MAPPNTSAGYEATLGIAEETTYGTGVNAATFYQLVEPPTMDFGYKPMLKRVMGGQFSRKAVDAPIDPTLSFKIITSYADLGYLLAHAIGDDSVGVSGAGPYTHTIAAATMPVGLSIEADDGAASRTSGQTPRFIGCQIEKLTLNQAYGELLEVSVDCVASDVEFVTKQAVSYATDNLLEYSSLGTMTVNSAAQQLRSLELSINNELRKDRRTMGNKVRTGLDRKFMNVTGTAEVEFDSQDEVDLAINGTDTPMTFTWTGASSHSLSLVFTGSNVMSANPGASGEDDYLVPIEFDADGDKLTATLIDSVSSY